VRHIVFASVSPNDTRPQPSTLTLPQKIQRDLRVFINCMRHFKGRILKSASLRKPNVAFSQQNEERVFNNLRSRLKICILPQIEGCVASSKLKSSGLRRFNNSVSRPFNNSVSRPPNESEPRLSTIQSRVLLTTQSHASQQFRTASSK